MIYPDQSWLIIFVADVTPSHSRHAGPFLVYIWLVWWSQWTCPKFRSHLLCVKDSTFLWAKFPIVWIYKYILIFNYKDVYVPVVDQIAFKNPECLLQNKKMAYETPIL